MLSRSTGPATRGSRRGPRKHGTRRLLLAQSYGDQATGLLREAIDKGFADTRRIKEDKWLDPVRSREDFVKLLEELEETKTPDHR